MRAIKLLPLVVVCLCGATLCLAAPVPDKPITVRVASYNVEFGRSTTPEQVGEMFKPYMLDIIGFDEAPDGDWTARVGKVLGMEHSYVGKISSANHKDKYKTILSRTPLENPEEHKLTGRGWNPASVVRATTKIDGVSFAFYSLHICKSGANDGHAHSLATKVLPEEVTERVIVVGDFNNNIGDAVMKTIEGAGFRPTWNDLKIDLSKEFTYNAQNPKKNLGIIDHILYNNLSGAQATDGGIIELKKPLSDHKPIWAEIVFPRDLDKVNGDAKAGAGPKTYLPNSKSNPLAPTVADVRYGEHERNKLDFWQAESDKPTPVIMILHGGGWTAGSKANVSRSPRFPNLRAIVGEGISVVAIDYRLIGKHTEGVMPPVKATLHDAARALQFVRSKAREWNINKERIGAYGNSAGGCSSLWLAYHDDLADPKSEDPVARESTRLWCAAGSGAQTTLDPKQLKKWFTNPGYGGHAFGDYAYGKEFEKFLADREKLLPWIVEYSPWGLVSAGDPPVYLSRSEKEVS